MGKTQEELKKAFDSSTLNSKFVSLNEEQSNAFIDTIVDESVMLKKARVQKMSKPNTSVARIGFNNRFLHPGTSGSQLDDSKRAEFGSEEIQLESKLIKGKFMITDEEREDVSQENLDGYLLGLVAKKVANELELASMISRKVASSPDIDHLFDGFIYRGLQDGNIINCADTGLFADRYVSKEKFLKGLKSLPTRFRANAKFFVPSDVMLDYQALYDTVADGSVRAELQNLICKKEAVEVMLMETGAPVEKTGTHGSTTTSAGVAAGQTVVPFTAVTNFSVGDEIVFNLGDADEQVRTITNISSLNVTIDSALTFALGSGDPIKEVTTDGAYSLLTNPQNLIYGIQKYFTFETERIASVGTQYHFKCRVDFQVEDPTALVVYKDMLVK